MVCPKCGSENVSVQVVSEIELKNKHHGAIWWICVGWWWIPIKWMCFTIPALIFKIFGSKKQKVKQTNVSMCICQNCGNQWKVQ